MHGNLTGIGLFALILGTGALLLLVGLVLLGLAAWRRHRGQPARWPVGTFIAFALNVLALVGLTEIDNTGNLWAFAKPLEDWFILTALGWLLLLGMAAWLGRRWLR